MSNSRYSLFLKDNFNLIRSLVIKNRLTALAFNEKLKLNGYAVGDDESKWKYNLNLAGIPHEADEPMTVTSIDTLEEIEFSLETLTQHRATLFDFKTKGIAYIELVGRYPDQSVLIDGILDPTPIDEVMSAPDWTILKYDTSLIEPQETNILIKLQEWVNGFTFRWFNPDYALIDNLYASSFIGVMFSHMTPALMDLRLANCKTSQVHSYHIWSHLDRFQGLGDYSSALTIGQALFLYRNIEYISRRSYRSDVFKLLVDALLTERGIPLYGYHLQHDISDLEESGPAAIMSREILNFDAGLAEFNARSVRAVLVDGLGLAAKNFDLLEPTVKHTEDNTIAASSDNFITKVVESDIRDTTNLDGISLSSLLVRQWLNLADSTVYSSGEDESATTTKYRARIAVNDPATDAGVRIDAREAWVLTMWLVAKADGNELTEVPEAIDYFAIKKTLPTLDELKRFTKGTTISDEMLQYVASFPTTGVIVSPITFRQHVVELREFMIKQKDLVGKQEHLFDHMALTLAVNFLYEPVSYSFAESSYADWFTERGLTMESLSPDECRNMALTIIDQFTGNTGVQQLSTFAIQRAMLDIVRRLANYDIQYLQSLNEAPLAIATNKTNRIDDIRTSAKAIPAVHWKLADVMDFTIRSKVNVSAALPERTMAYDMKNKGKVSLNPTVDLGISSIVRSRVTVPLPYVDMSIAAVRTSEPTEPVDPIEPVEPENNLMQIIAGDTFGSHEGTYYSIFGANVTTYWSEQYTMGELDSITNPNFTAGNGDEMTLLEFTASRGTPGSDIWGFINIQMNNHNYEDDGIWTSLTVDDGDGGVFTLQRHENSWAYHNPDANSTGYQWYGTHEFDSYVDIVATAKENGRTLTLTFNVNPLPQ